MDKSIKILYVEDDKWIIEFIKILFKEHDIENVTYALNGEEGLELYKNNDFDLVITDMIMPVMDGFELIENIKIINPKQIFMMVTGLDNKEDLIRAIKLRVNYFVEKPIEPKMFNQVLQEAMELVNQKKELAFSNLLLKQYKYAIDTSSVLSKTDLTGKITYINEEFCRLSKYSSHELVGKSHNIVRHPDTPKELFKDMWHTLHSKKVWRGVVKNMAKDGSVYIVDTIVIPILDIDDNAVEYMSIRNEITQLIHLQQEIEDTQKEVVFTMGAIGETRSKETGNHVKRVAEYSYLLASLSGLSKDEAELLKLASPMHDIGKVGIPDSILNKPGKHTDEEFEIMKTHSYLGYEMLKGSQREILKTSAIVAYEHHEKWDGNGYPRGLKAEDIHIYGRVTAVCDVFDALGADRCYKKAWNLEKILTLFKEERGRHFDPKLIDLFFDNLDKFLEIRDRYRD